MLKVKDVDGDTICVSDASDVLKAPGVGIVITNKGTGQGGEADDNAEVWLPAELARHVGRALIAYADMSEFRAEGLAQAARCAEFNCIGGH